VPVTYLLTAWWLPFLAAAAAVWTAALWPKVAREQAVRGRVLDLVSVLAVALVTPLTFVAGPHLDPRHLIDSAEVALPAWLAWTRQAVNLLLIGCFVVVLTTKTNRRRAGGWLVAAFAVFVGAGLLSAAASGTGLRSALLTALVAAPVAVFWASGRDWASTVPMLRLALRITVWVSLALAAAGPDWAYWPRGLGRTLLGVPQLVGATEHPNALGPTAATLVILEVARPRSRGWQLWASGPVIVLILAQSRTAWAALVVGALFAGAVARRGWQQWLAAIVTIALLWRLWAFPSVLDFTGRPTVWAYAWRQFRAHPLLGGGPGFLESAYREGRLPPELAWLPRHAHDQVLQAAAATGVVGLATLLVLISALGLAALRAATATGGASAALFGALLARCVTEVPLSTGVTGQFLNLVLFATMLAGLRTRLAAPLSTSDGPERTASRPAARASAGRVPAEVGSCSRQATTGRVRAVGGR
jgi:hypothetical protein